MKMKFNLTFSTASVSLSISLKCKTRVTSQFKMLQSPVTLWLQILACVHYVLIYRYLICISEKVDTNIKIGLFCSIALSQLWSCSVKWMWAKGLFMNNATLVRGRGNHFCDTMYKYSSHLSVTGRWGVRKSPDFYWCL